MQVKIEEQKRDPRRVKVLKTQQYQTVRKGIQFPLSPPAGKQIELKPLKSYDFKGFFFLSHIKLFIHS